MKCITAQDLYNFDKCPYRIYLDENGDKSQKQMVNSFVKLLWESGIKNEKEVVASLGYGKLVEVKEKEPNQARDKTLKLMRQGAPIIYQGCLFQNGMLGRPDLLIKKEGHSSNFGDFYYEVIDIKSGKGIADERSQRFKLHYAYQIIFYNNLLKIIQGYIYGKGKIINGNKEVEEFFIDDYKDCYVHALKEVRNLKTTKSHHEPIISSSCSLCVWEKVCKQWAKSEKDLSLIFFVGKTKYALKERGIKTIQDVANIDVNKYLKPPYKIKGLARKSLERMKNRARVILAGKPEIRSGFLFPERNKEYYFDIEEDPLQGIIYLFGFYSINEQNQKNFKYFLANDLDGEKQTVAALWEFLGKEENVTYYVYSPKERSTLKKLREKYDLDEAVLDKYLASEYDIYNLVVNYSDWPTYSYGLKKIAEQVGFKWRDEDPSGANSIVWYNQYVETKDKKILQRILDYNEDDCIATHAIKKYFDKHEA
ncbi:TM0106 family RecB-like putative nuclease [Candidatus Margulisiibacteriota bacterium]